MKSIYLNILKRLGIKKKKNNDYVANDVMDEMANMGLATINDVL